MVVAQLRFLVMVLPLLLLFLFLVFVLVVVNTLDCLSCLLLWLLSRMVLVVRALLFQLLLRVFVVPVFVVCCLPRVGVMVAWVFMRSWVSKPLGQGRCTCKGV